MKFRTQIRHGRIVHTETIEANSSAEALTYALRDFERAFAYLGLLDTRKISVSVMKEKNQ